MQDLFFACLNINDNNYKEFVADETQKYVQLKHLLKSYSLLSKQRLVEQLFTEHKVKPYLEMVNQQQQQQK